jgi:mRNA interferase RelE/StbE
MVYQIYVTAHAAEGAKKLHPDIRKDIKAELKTLIEKPYKGKPLQQELQGFYSLRVSRYRAIYTVRTDLKIVEVWAIGHRKDIYELFSELVLNGSVPLRGFIESRQRDNVNE